MIYDREKDLNTAAQSAYEEARRSPFSKCFLTMAPGDWQNFIALQPADLIAFEGYKLTDSFKLGKRHLRQSLLGIDNPLAAGYFTEESFRQLKETGFMPMPR